MADRITILIEGQHGSISNLEWPDVPPFAVITGVNGAGKSQLLEVLAYSYNALQPRPHGPMLSQPPQLGVGPISRERYSRPGRSIMRMANGRSLVEGERRRKK